MRNVHIQQWVKPGWTLALIAAMHLLNGCVGSMKPIYDAPEQVVEVEGLTGDWRHTVEPGENLFVRFQSAEIDGLTGYRIYWLDLSPPDDAPEAQVEGRVIVIDTLIGRFGERLIAQLRGNAEVTRELMPDADWIPEPDGDRPNYLLLAIRVGEEDRLIVDATVARYYLLGALDEAEGAPQVEGSGIGRITFDDDPARVRKFLAQHADGIWKHADDAMLEFHRADAEEFDEIFEQITGESFDDAVARP